MSAPPPDADPLALAGRVALVTGSERGIGAAIARRLGAQGAAVGVCAFAEPDRAAAVADDVVRAGGRAHVVSGDVAVLADVEHMVAEVAAHLGPVDVLVNNAGIIQGTVPWTGIGEDEWDRIMAVNLKGAFLCARTVHPGMRERGWGRIVNISSVTVHVGHVVGVDYVASKAGLIGFTRSLAREVGPEGITVNAVTPGAVRTTAPEDDPEAASRAWFLAQQAIGEQVLPEDIAGAVAYLASDAARLVTGQVLNVDGGWAMP